ncbi:hypothetical protein V5O48_010765 [Marasmius crinis-equi]|uniref:Uncharacterized protein n=1 Tax=Marasmius crinis-equi TaxID=585013 RepID=A0ABR3F7I1_9AGAR
MSNTQGQNVETNSAEQASRNAAEAPAYITSEQITAIVEEAVSRRLESALEQVLAEKLTGLLEGNSIALRDQIDTPEAATQTDDANATNSAANTTASNDQTQPQPPAPTCAVGPGGNSTANSIMCCHCHLPVPLNSSDERWYAVWRARRIGWVKGADIISPLTLGVRGAGFKFCASEEAARAAFHTKQVMKATAVLADNEDVSFTLPIESGCLFP